MKDSDWVMYTFNMLELQKKEKGDAKKNKISEKHNEDKSGKDQEESSEKTLPNKQKQKVIQGKSKIQTEEVKWNEESSSKPSRKKGKDADDHVQQGTPENIISSSNIIDLTIKVIQNEIFEERNGNDVRKDFFTEKLTDQQQQQDINDEFGINRVICEDSLANNSNRIISDSNINYGSKLWTRDEKDGNYRITQGIPRSIKFRSIANIYKCTDRLSSVEDEYNWKLPSEEESNMNLSTKEDSSIIKNKKDIGCKRKWMGNQKVDGENDATTSST